MALVWTGLAGGGVAFCALVVAVNPVLQMVLYAPLALLFVGVIGRRREEGSAKAVVDRLAYATVAMSVVVFLPRHPSRCGGRDKSLASKARRRKMGSGRLCQIHLHILTLWPPFHYHRSLVHGREQ